MKKIRTIEQSQLMNSEEMKNSHGGMTCPNENGVYNTCSLTNFYMNCPSLTLYKICGDYISEPCVIHETCKIDSHRLELDTKQFIQLTKTYKTAVINLFMRK